ncbi:MAG: hypothetical protein ACI9EW_002208 [Cellvibrionaceae bacterium]|jgi:hypothetical protein
MKKFYITLTLFLLVAMFGIQAVAANEFGTYNAGFQVQNLSANVATIEITYYNQDGTTATSVSDTVPANDSNNYATLPVGAGFDGSVVISSNEPVAAIVNVNASASSLTYGASYSSISTGSETVSLPIINHDFFNIDTQVSVQNAGSTAASVTITYANTACTEIASIPVGAVHRFKQASNTCLPAKYNGAATVTAGEGQSIVATVLQESPNALLAYNGFTNGSTAPAMPLITQNFFGIETGVQIQNLGSTDTVVTVSYSPADGVGTACTESATIPAGSAVNFALDAFVADIQTNTTNTCTLGQTFNGTASVTANSESQPLAGIVNQTIPSKGQASAYSAFDPSAAGQTVVLPLTMNKFSIWTGFTVQNVGTASDTITCTFSAIDGTAPSVKSGTAGIGAGVSLNNFSDSEFIGSASCTSTGGEPIVAVVNQSITGGTGDYTYTYEAFGK